jgi:hypothetical protein
VDILLVGNYFKTAVEIAKLTTIVLSSNVAYKSILENESNIAVAVDTAYLTPALEILAKLAF